MNKNKTFIIAELSANHNQNYDLAIKTILAMKKSGADAVKFQTYTPDTMTINMRSNGFIKKNGLWKGKSLYELYTEAQTPWSWQKSLKEYAEKIGLFCFSSPFDKSAVDFLETLNVSAYKIASFEITDIPLIEYAASKGKPMIISTGIATISEIQDAVDICRSVKNNDITLLKCTSSYPAPIETMNLKTISNMKETFNVKVGLSDHTLCNDVSIAAVALGATVIEKHFILDKNIGGPDSAFSLEPKEFELLVKSIRNVEKALGKIDYTITDDKATSRENARSLYVIKDIKTGESLSKENIRSIRPGFGLPPKHIDFVIGKKALYQLKKGTPLNWNMFEF